MSEHRRLRFSDIMGIERSDLPFACDIWLEDIYRAPWGTREVMKLAAYFVRYMSKPDANALSIREVESQIQMAPEELRKTLVLMRAFNAVEGFLIERNDIRVGLKLSHMQRLRVLEARSRFAVLLAEPVARDWPWTTAEERWVPGQAPAPSAAARAPAPVVAGCATAALSSIVPLPVERTATGAPVACVGPVALLLPIAPSELPQAHASDGAQLAESIDILTKSDNTIEFSAT